jgi:hypothetical protein
MILGGFTLQFSGSAAASIFGRVFLVMLQEICLVFA